jgi:hypothetical protein
LSLGIAAADSATDPIVPCACAEDEATVFRFSLSLVDEVQIEDRDFSE